MTGPDISFGGIMGNWRGGFPKCIAVVDIGSGLYDVRSYGTRELMERHAKRNLAVWQTVTFYEHNGTDYIKI
jgi:hypothetical protein